MPSFIQPSFSKGEISPSLYGRVDTSIYGIALRTARNTIIHTTGGASNRNGTRFIGPVADHTNSPRLIPFKFKTTDKYMLEFGDFYMRVIRNDGHVLEPAQNIITATQTDPVVVQVPAHGYDDGDEFLITGVVGMTELNGKRFKVGVGSPAGAIRLDDQVTSADVDGTGFNAYISGGTVARVFTLTTPYAVADLPDLVYTQSADVMTLAHKSYPVQELSRLDHDNWVMSEITFGPTQGFPTGVSVTVDTAGIETDRYRVTAISLETAEESLPGLNTNTETITAATAANPVVVTSATHGYITGDEVYIDSVVGMTEINARRFLVTVLTADTFELDGEDGTGHTAYVSGGTSNLTFYRITTGAFVWNNTINWTAVAGADRYSIYRFKRGVYGLIGETEALTFKDNNIDADVSISHPRKRNPFIGSNNQPGAVGYFEQRRAFGSTLNQPDTTFYTQVANQNNMNISQPLKQDDAIIATLNSLQVNEIRHFVPLNDLLIFTEGGEWRINSGDAAAFAADTIKQKPQSLWGSSFRQPIVVGNTVIYVEANDRNVRSLGFSLTSNSYVGSPLDQLSQHLLNGFTIREMSYARSPESRMYFARSDGQALTMSFEQSQEVVAWTHWDTDGKYENTASLKGGGLANEDSVYFVVKRTVNGNTVRYIEVYRQLFFEDVQDCFFVDSGLSLDDPIAITGVTLANPVVVTTATAHGFANGDQIDLTDIEWTPDVDATFNYTQPAQLNSKRFVAANVTSTTFELTAEDGTAFNAYVEGGNARKAVLTVTGGEHLEGREIVILADGNVIRGTTMVNGSFTLARRASRIHFGLGFVSDIETLNAEAPSGTLQGKKTNIPSVTIRFEKSRGMLIGPNSSRLLEMKQREDEAYDEPTRLLTGDKRIDLEPEWNSNGRVFLRQKDPLPMSVLAVIPDIEIEDV